MTETDPRPQLAAMPAARLAPCSTGAPGACPNRRPAYTPADASGQPAAERPDAGAGHDGRLIECHVGGRVSVGLPDTPEFEAWREKQEAATCAHDKT